VVSTKRQYQIPDGSITYSDLDIPAKPLFSKRYRISGKPDYIVEKNGQYIPVGLKSGSHSSPLKNHVLQLGTYCQLIEDAYGTYVPYGVLVYDSESFVILFNPQLRFEVSSTIKKMRTCLHDERVIINHDEGRRCNACSMRRFCGERIA